MKILSGIVNILFALFWIMAAILTIIGLTLPPFIIFCGLLVAAVSYIYEAVIDFSKK